MICLAQAPFRNLDTLFGVYHFAGFLVLLKLKFKDQLIYPEPLALPKFVSFHSDFMNDFDQSVSENYKVFSPADFHDRFTSKLSDTLAALNPVA